jgi:nicotinate-nucleotide adenylyltransferase
MIEEKSATRIGIFGGTFDPIHLGHLHLATLAREFCHLDEVRFVPCQISPHKTGTPPTAAEDRLAMLKLALAEIPWAVIDPIELLTPGPTYSFETAAAMAGKFPQARLFWIMGSDQWAALPRWKNPERLAELVEFILLMRDEVPEPRPGYRLHVVPGAHPASATKIRAAIASGKFPPWLDPAVAREITRRGLYQP